MDKGKIAGPLRQCTALSDSAARNSRGVDSTSNLSGLDRAQRRRAEETLQNSEERFRNIFETAPHLIISVDAQGIIADCNKRIRRVLGYEKQEIIGQSMKKIVHPDDHSIVFDALKEIFSKGFSYDKEYKMVRKDGRLIDVSANSSGIKDDDGYICRTICIIEDITQRKQAQDQLMSYQSQLKSMTSALTLAEERLKKTLALHLHDNIAQSLVMLRVDIGLLERDSQEKGIKESLHKMYETVGQVLDQTQSLTSQLSFPVLALHGLEEAIRQWSDQEIRKKYGLEVSVSTDGESKPLSEDVQAVLFRGIRELLINVVKHAQARAVDIDISRIGDSIRLKVQDDGIGLADRAPSDQERTGFGILSVAEAIEKLGGSLTYASEPSQGCAAVLMAPLDLNAPRVLQGTEESL